MKERCEIDLSPGTRAVPESDDDRRAVAGCGLASCAIFDCPGFVRPSFAQSRGVVVFAGTFLTCPHLAVIPKKAAKPLSAPVAFGFDSAANCD
jgi:hypothetical protein